MIKYTMVFIYFRSCTWLYWFFLFWWFLCITSLTKETLQGFAAWARKHCHAKRLKPDLFPDLPLNCNPHHYDNHHDYSPPPSQEKKHFFRTALFTITILPG